MARMKVCMVTSTRADWGLLTPLARALREHPGVDLRIVATNMHLLENHGMTINEILDAGFTVDARVPMDVAGERPADKVLAMSRCMAGMAEAFSAIRPNAVVILGDRFEMLAVASAAAVMRIPIVHIAGGTVSEGAIDDSIRHAITKLSTLHLVETEEFRRRVIQMGEEPDRVVNTGALGVYNIMHQPLMDAARLAASLDGFDLSDGPSMLVTYHPATLDNGDPADQVRDLIAAIDPFTDCKVLFTHPNNDAGGDIIAAKIEEYVAANPGRVHAVRSLGMIRYLSALRFVDVVVGNSSSGIVEVPSMHIPTVDIGIRQRGRLCGASVIHCSTDPADIQQAIEYALSPAGRHRARIAENPYYRADTVGLMVDAITALDAGPAGPKKFYNLPQA